jgi:CarboxypepD_reg-like domain/TonB-dependent Receptor Plug Domain
MNKTVILSCIAALLFNVSWMYAQSGSVKGIITDAETKETLIGVTVLLEGTTKGATTDIDGNYIISDIPSGKINLVISYVGYVQQVIREVVVKSTETTFLNIKLVNSVNELKGTEISAKKITHTENAVLAEMRNAEQIVNGISSQQIAKTQDRSTTDVMRRIPGVTVIEDKFIMVRGLSDRYNVVMLNDAVAPSIEPDKKAFSFDLIPSGLLDRILIYKTGSPELPGEFAGGAIKIFTRNIPDENITQVGYSASFRTATTFKNINEGQSGKFDKFGFDGGERDLPSRFPSNLNGYYGEDLSEISRSLPNTWALNQQKALPDQRFNFLMARAFKIGGIKAGNITNVSYGILNETRVRTMSNFNDYNEALKKSEPIYNYTDTLGYNKVNVGVISNWSFVFNSRNKIEFYNLFNQSGVNQTLVREGPNFEAGSYFRNYAIRYNQRAFYTGQLSGEHLFNNNNTKLNWIAGINSGSTKDPDFRRVQTNRPIENPNAPYAIVLGSSASIDQLGRFYSELYENTFSGGISAEHKFTFKNSSFSPKLRAGISFENKNREFDARWLSYIKSFSDQFNYSLLNQPVEEALANNNINPVTGFKLTEGTNPFDSYTNSSELQAFYLGTTIPVNDKITISGGARVENYLMKQNTRDELKNPLVTELSSSFILPSVNLSYYFNAKSLLRMAYFKSLNRPEFREIELYSFFDFIRNEVLLGNSELKTADVHNADLRWEYYPTTGELISVGAFYKLFNNPIEKYALSGAGGGTRSFRFDNAVQSSSLGAEIEVRKSMQTLFSNPFLKRISLTMNASYIVSSVDLGEKAVFQNDKRPMMGQSPYMVNTGIFYNDFDKKWQFNLMYNIIGKRLFAIGSDRSQPDIYEMPRNLFDASVTKGIGEHFEIKVGVKDIFNNSFKYVQDADEDGDFDNNDQTIESFRPGSYYTVGLTYRY